MCFLINFSQKAYKYVFAGMAGALSPSIPNIISFKFFLRLVILQSYEIGQYQPFSMC